MKRFKLMLMFVLTAISGMAQFSDAQIIMPDIEEGIILIAKSDSTQLDSIKETKIQPITYFKQKHGVGAFASAMTYGLAGMRSVNLYAGPTSPNIAHIGDTFRFVFGEIDADYIAQLYMFTPAFTIRDFGLAKFNKKKKHRELTTGKISIWAGTDIGADVSKDIEFSVRTVSPNVYEATIIKGVAGEYCFIFTNHGLGAYTYVFDFSLEL